MRKLIVILSLIFCISLGGCQKVPEEPKIEKHIVCTTTIDISELQSEKLQLIKIEKAFQDKEALRRKVDIASISKRYIGVPYVWGGVTPRGFDCSGFVQYVLRQGGYDIGRTVTLQYIDTNIILKENASPGDLVFFQNTYTSGLSHVGIYMGDDKFIHASSSKGVTISSLNETYWINHFHSFGRYR